MWLTLNINCFYKNFQVKVLKEVSLMTDVMTKEQRRKNMQAIKSISKLEKIVSKELWKKGLRFRTNTKNLFGKPDLSIKKYKIVIFVDSCFWHRCPIHGNMPKNNADFWYRKLTRNVDRDKEVNDYYTKKIEFHPQTHV